MDNNAKPVRLAQPFLDNFSLQKLSSGMNSSLKPPRFAPFAPRTPPGEILVSEDPLLRAGGLFQIVRTH